MGRKPTVHKDEILTCKNCENDKFHCIRNIHKGIIEIQVQCIECKINIAYWTYQK